VSRRSSIVSFFDICAPRCRKYVLVRFLNTSVPPPLWIWHPRLSSSTGIRAWVLSWCSVLQASHCTNPESGAFEQTPSSAAVLAWLFTGILLMSIYSPIPYQPNYFCNDRNGKTLSCQQTSAGSKVMQVMHFTWAKPLFVVICPHFQTLSNRPNGFDLITLIHLTCWPHDPLMISCRIQDIPENKPFTRHPFTSIFHRKRNSDRVSGRYIHDPAEDLRPVGNLRLHDSLSRSTNGQRWLIQRNIRAGSFSRISLGKGAGALPTRNDCHTSTQWAGSRPAPIQGSSSMGLLPELGFPPHWSLHEPFTMSERFSD
jgi:hypothetical protein